MSAKKDGLTGELKDIGSQAGLLPERPNVRIFETDIEPRKESFENEASFKVRKIFTPNKINFIGRDKKSLRKNLRRSGLARVWKIGKMRRLRGDEALRAKYFVM